MLPLLAAHMHETGAASEDLFLDEDHLTVRGHRFVAGVLAPHIAGMLE